MLLKLGCKVTDKAKDSIVKLIYGRSLIYEEASLEKHLKALLNNQPKRCLINKTKDDNVIGLYYIGDCVCMDKHSKDCIKNISQKTKRRNSIMVTT